MAAVSATLQPDRDDQSLCLIDKLRSTDDPAEARDVLDCVVRLNMPVARSIAASYSRRGIDHDDLYQVACLALLKAVYGFDEARGRRFTSYAVPTIRGELRRYFRDQSSAVRPPRELQELRLAIAVARGDLTQRLGREATVLDMSRAVGASPEMIRRAQLAAANHHPTSLDAQVGSTSPLSDRLACAVDEMDRLEWRVTLQDAVDELDERSCDILRMRFVDDLTQVQIARRLGVSQMHVSRLLSKILHRLRERMEPSPPGS